LNKLNTTIKDDQLSPILCTTSPRWHCSRASSNRKSGWWPWGSRFSRTELEKRKGSWGMMASF